MCINIYKPYPITYISSKSIYSKFINKKKVNHIDGNKLNSKLTNLECCTASENSQNAHDTGLKILLIKNLLFNMILR